MKLNIVPVISALFFLFIGCEKDDDAATGPEYTLDAPTELSLARIGKTAVRLTWKDNSLKEEGFVIERRVSPGSYQALLFTVLDVATAVDSVGLVADSTYNYRVQAIRYSERGAYSNAATIKLALPYP